MEIVHKILFVIYLSCLTGMLYGKGHDMPFNLMPMPEKLELMDGKFRLTESFTMGIQGKAEDRLIAYTTRTLRRLSGRTGLFFSQDHITSVKASAVVDLKIICLRPGVVKLKEDESYRLVVSPDHIELEAATDIGAMRGLETFLQLLMVDENGYFFPAIVITDRPRFPWRGLMIDVGRHFMPVHVIKHNLDGMAAVKMNVLHWHLSEDQGFRVECKTFPKLHELGSDGLYYTHDQIKEIIDYAADRGIRVMPEFDIPGHSTSWLVAYPELASLPGPYRIERKWGIFNPTFDPTQNDTYRFFDKFFKEMAQLFPDEYIHIGGDENNGKQWAANVRIQQFMKENNLPDRHALQNYFNRRILDILNRYDKKMVGWDEILVPELPKNIVVHTWRGKKSLYQSARKGYQGILSNGYYIDLIQPAAEHYLNDPLPADSVLTDSQKSLILGGEATMWSEFVTPETIDSRIWPRTAAIAERFWSPESVQDVEEMYRRLEIISLQLEELDLTHEKNYGLMLRRLAGSRDISVLKNFVDVVEPVKEYRRNRLRPHTSFSPMTRVIDAARPDAQIPRYFKKMVARYITSPMPEDVQSIEKWLILWQGNHKNLAELFRSSPVLQEIKSLSSDLANCATIGLVAMELIKGNRVATESWVKSKLNELEKAKEPRGQVELMIIPALELLVRRAGGNTKM